MSTTLPTDATDAADDTANGATSATLAATDAPHTAGITTPRPHRSAPRAGSRAERRAAEPRRPHTALYLILGIVLWLLLGLVVVVGLQDRIVLAGWSFLGAFLVPSALVYAMAGRLRPDDSLSPSDLARFMLLGGFLAFCLGGTIDALIAFFAPGPNPSTPSMLSFALSGVVEEFAKVLLVIILARKTVKTARNGLFVGGAVGAGFAAFETLGYVIYEPIVANRVAEGGFVQLDAIVAIDRAVTAPIGHPLWAALLAAAVFAVAARHGGRYRITLALFGAYLGVALLHGANDVGLTVLGDYVKNLVFVVPLGWIVCSVIALPGFFIWRHVTKATAPAPQSVSA